MSLEEEIKPTPDLFQRITDLLELHKVEYKVIEHEEIDGSAAGSSAMTKTRPEQGAKTLIMMVNEIQPIMVVLRGSDRADRNALKKAISSGDVRMATLDEVQIATNSEVGTLPPIGSLFNIPTYFDKCLADEGEIAFGTGLRTKTIVMRADNFLQATKPIVGDFAKNRQCPLGFGADN